MVKIKKITNKLLTKKSSSRGGNNGKHPQRSKQQKFKGIAIATAAALGLTAIAYLGTPMALGPKRKSSNQITSTIGFGYIANNNLKAIRSIPSQDAMYIKDPFGRNLLMFAAYSGNYKATKILLQKGFLVNRVDLDGNTALIYSIKSANEKVIDLLLKNGADPSASNSIGVSPLIANSYYGNPAIASNLIKHGANVNQFDNQLNTPLLSAINGGKPEIALHLLEKHHASPSIINKKGETPLIAAIKERRNQLAIKLVKATNQLGVKDATGSNALHWAIARNATEVASEILNANPALAEEPLNNIYPAEMARRVSREMLSIISHHNRNNGKLPEINGHQSEVINKAINSQTQVQQKPLAQAQVKAAHKGTKPNTLPKKSPPQNGSNKNNKVTYRPKTTSSQRGAFKNGTKAKQANKVYPQAKRGNANTKPKSKVKK